jgi:hypothetical protein
MRVDIDNFIEEAADLNNKIRVTINPILKIELMHDLGGLLKNYLKKTKLKLHPFLKLVYDPHSNNKYSNITRDLLSYCYRINNFFIKKSDIKSKLENLQNYSLFREAFPLLENEKYKLTNKGKQHIFQLLNNNKVNVKDSLTYLKREKKAILNIRNPRNQKIKMYDEVKRDLTIFIKNVNTYYQNNQTSNIVEINKLYGTEQAFQQLILVLTVLGNETFCQNLEKITLSQNKDMLFAKLFEIANSSSENRARFRKTVIIPSEIFKLIEKITGLHNQSDYQYIRAKYYTNSASN